MFHETMTNKSNLKLKLRQRKKLLFKSHSLLTCDKHQISCLSSAASEMILSGSLDLNTHQIWPL